MRCLQEILEEKPQTLEELCLRLKLPILRRPIEADFTSEYCEVYRKENPHGGDETAPSAISDLARGNYHGTPGDTQVQRLAGLPELKEKVDSMERSVQFLSKQFDDFEKTLKVHDTEIKELKRRVTDLQKKDELSRAANDQLQKEVNDLEFRSRRLNLEVHGIPEVQGENLIETLNKVAEKLELTLGERKHVAEAGARKRLETRLESRSARASFPPVSAILSQLRRCFHVPLQELVPQAPFPDDLPLKTRSIVPAAVFKGKLLNSDHSRQGQGKR
ncbi:hypothetical protein HPB47_015768 [Ixodes persulcatus]|uniref:Uncharacterized protein n=1 Tax=Ixodes persulcatus TaxID=34615 RepID=A0AC60QSK4_IXOPE|nr:hypothetical protein HPB47_015768 [Ixodes persulcatus]